MKELDPCPECEGILRSWPAEATTIVCTTCHAELTCPPDHPRPQPAPIRKHRRTHAPPLSTLVERFVRDVLRWSEQVNRVERQARGTQSTLAGMLARVELYGYDQNGDRIDGAKIGKGVKGTHGAVEGGAYEEPDPVHVDPVAQARYNGLSQLDRSTVDAITEDEAGDTPTQRFFGAQGHTLTLAVRVAFKITDGATREKWAAKLAGADPAPALAAAARLGTARIESAAVAWWRASE